MCFYLYCIKIFNHFINCPKRSFRKYPQSFCILYIVFEVVLKQAQRYTNVISSCYVKKSVLFVVQISLSVVNKVFYLNFLNFQKLLVNEIESVKYPHKHDLNHLHKSMTLEWAVVPKLSFVYCHNIYLRVLEAGYIVWPMISFPSNVYLEKV